MRKSQDTGPVRVMTCTGPVFFCKLLLNCASHDTKISCIRLVWAGAKKYKFWFLLCAGPLKCNFLSISCCSLFYKRSKNLWKLLGQFPPFQGRSSVSAVPGAPQIGWYPLDRLCSIQHRNKYCYSNRSYSSSTLSFCPSPGQPTHLRTLFYC